METSEDTLIVNNLSVGGQIIVASSGWRPRVLLHTLQSQAGPHSKEAALQMSAVGLLGKPAVTPSVDWSYKT